MFKIGAYEFSELDVASATLASQASGLDTLTLQLAKPINATSVFDPYEAAVLTEDGTARFTGWLDVKSLAATGSSQAHTLTFQSAFRFLDLRNYYQPRFVQTSSTTWEEFQTNEVMLGKSVEIAGPDGPEILQLTAQQQLIKIVEQFESEFPSSQITGTLPALKLPWLPRTNATLGTCLLAILAWLPKYCLRSDGYDLVIVDTSAEDAHDVTELNCQVEDIKITPRYDLLKAETKLTYTKPGAETVPEALLSYYVRVDTATSSNASPRKWAYSIPLEDGEPFPDLGIADQLHQWDGYLLLDTSLTLRGLHWEMLIGQKLNLGGLFPNFASTPVIQTITRDLFRKTIQIAAGPRKHLSLDQLLELNRKAPKGGGGGGPDNQETQATIQRTIEDPNSDAVAGGAYFSIGDKVVSSGGQITVDPGEYTILYHVPPDYVPPDPEDIKVTPGGNSNETVTATFRERIRLRRADGLLTEDIDIRVADLPDNVGTAKFREVERCDGKKAMVLMTDWY